MGFASTIVKQGMNSVLSRDPLGKGAVRWTGAETSPMPVKGASIAIMPCPLAFEVCQKNLKTATAAATEMGWEVVPVNSKGDPATAQRGVDAAINPGVKRVLTLGSPSRDIRAQIQRGKEKGVAFVIGFSDDPREFGGDVGFGIDQAAAGKLLGAYVVANGGGKVVIFNAPAFPQLAVRLQGFKDYLAEHGGGRAEVVEEVEFNVGAGAPDLITKTQAILTKYPKDREHLFGGAERFGRQTAKGHLVQTRKPDANPEVVDAPDHRSFASKACLRPGRTRHCAWQPTDPALRVAANVGKYHSAKPVDQ